jgi:hypothetical protein
MEDQMKKLLAGAAMAVMATAANAVTWNSVAGAPDPGPGPGQTILFDFEAATPELTGQYGLYTGSVPGQYAAPAGDATQYAVVPTAGLGGGTATLDLTGLPKAIKSFSFYWGSIDTYNSIDLVGPGGIIQTIGGGALPPANGDQGSAITNRRIFVTLGPGESIDSINFNSTGVAFEFDDFAASYVPEPQSWLLMILGFGFVGAAARRRAAVPAVTA